MEHLVISGVGEAGEGLGCCTALSIRQGRRKDCHYWQVTLKVRVCYLLLAFPSPAPEKKLIRMGRHADEVPLGRICVWADGYLTAKVEWQPFILRGWLSTGKEKMEWEASGRSLPGQSEKDLNFSVKREEIQMEEGFPSGLWISGARIDLGRWSEMAVVMMTVGLDTPLPSHPQLVPTNGKWCPLFHQRARQFVASQLWPW